MPVFKHINKDFFKKWTPEMSYILGFFAADGYITVNRRGGQFWCIDITDKQLIEKIKDKIKSNHKISVRKRGGGKYTSYRLQIGSIEMCDDLRQLGYDERKTKSLAVPHVPEKYFRDFVRGYFDGDGNVWTGLIHKDRKTYTLSIRVVFTSCSKGFLEKLKFRLKNSGIEIGKLNKGNGNYFVLVYSILSSLKLYDFMYNGISRANNSLHLNRKKKIFDKYIKMRS